MTRSKRLALIDSVEWAPCYSPDHSLRNVPRWFQRHFSSSPFLEWVVLRWDELAAHSVPEGVDGVIMSGSPRDAWAEDPVNDRMVEVVQTCLSSEIPFLGVCYGHQILGRALGAEVGRHPEGLQLGPVRMALTAEGQQDVLFSGIEARFEALSGHADYVATLPEGAVHLASGGVTPMQSFRLGERAYGVQFHPEMDADILRFLWQPRVEDWQPRVSFDLAERVAAIHDTPVATKVLTNFVEHIVWAT